MKAWHVSAAGVLFAALALAVMAQEPPGMGREDVVVVLYEPGPNVEALGAHRVAHEQFWLTQMKAGRLLHAGPFQDRIAGLSIYKMRDPKAVEALVCQDPLVSHRVVTYRLHRWHMCSLTASEQGRRR
jgi:uncharacterized protein YciI